MVALVDDDHDLAKESEIGELSGNPYVNHVRNAEGNFKSIGISGAKTVKATRAALNKALRATMPKRPDCFLVIENVPSTAEIYFAWIAIDKDTSRLDAGDEFLFSYESCSSTRSVKTKVFYDMDSAITHLLSFIPQIECFIKQNEIKKAEDDNRVKKAKKKLRF